MRLYAVYVTPDKSRDYHGLRRESLFQGKVVRFFRARVYKVPYEKELQDDKGFSLSLFFYLCFLGY